MSSTGLSAPRVHSLPLTVASFLPIFLLESLTFFSTGKISSFSFLSSSYTHSLCMYLQSYNIVVMSQFSKARILNFSHFLLYSFQSYSPPPPNQPDLWRISFPSVYLNKKYFYNIFHVRTETILCKIAVNLEMP